MAVQACPRCDATGKVTSWSGLKEPCPMCDGHGLINSDGKEFWPVKKREDDTK